MEWALRLRDAGPNQDVADQSEYGPCGIDCEEDAEDEQGAVPAHWRSFP